MERVVRLVYNSGLQRAELAFKTKELSYCLVSQMTFDQMTIVPMTFSAIRLSAKWRRAFASPPPKMFFSQNLLKIGATTIFIFQLSLWRTTKIPLEMLLLFKLLV